MKTKDVNAELVDTYLKMLANLSDDTKLDLIAKLTMSLKSDQPKRKDDFDTTYGGWESDKSAEEMADEIRSSRTFNRKTEEL